MFALSQEDAASNGRLPSGGRRLFTPTGYSTPAQGREAHPGSPVPPINPAGVVHGHGRGVPLSRLRSMHFRRPALFDGFPPMPQSLAQIYLHIVFSTKDRRPFLKDAALRNGMFAYMVGILNGAGCTAIKIGGVEDHVHILCRLAEPSRLPI